LVPAQASFKDYLDIVRRRRWSLVLPALIVSLTAVAIALFLPPTYQSSATILIEDQEIPQDFVMATVTSFAETRIQTINQRIMSTTRLLDIIKQFDLYAKERSKRTTEEIIKQMREDIQLKPISADVKDPRTGRAGKSTIAFTLSFMGDNPKKVMDVTSMLTSLYLEENLKVRARQTEETSSFLEDEMNKVKSYLDEIEKQLGRFRQEHFNELPERQPVNLQELAAVERDIGRIEEQLNSAKSRQALFQSQLDATSPKLQQEDRNQRLEALKGQLVYLQTRFSDQYPDVIKTRQEIEALEKQLESDGVKQGTDTTKPDNPAHLALAAQVEALKIEQESFRRQIEELSKTRADYLRRIETSPQLEQQYTSLLIERDNGRAKYNDLMKKLMEAKVAHGLEKEQKGERFTLIDPARMPEKPFKPNRPAIMLIGIVLGLGSGFALMALREVFDHAVRSPDYLAAVSGIAVLASIPEIVTAQDRQRRQRRFKIAVATALTVTVLAVAGFHFFIMDLDIFWAKLTRLLHRWLPA